MPHAVWMKAFSRQGGTCVDAALAVLGEDVPDSEPS